MVERTALKREGSRGLGSDTYRVRAVQKKSQSGSGGRGWLPLVAAGRLQLHHGDEFVIIVAAYKDPRPMTSKEVLGLTVSWKGRSRLVVEELGGIHGESRYGG